MKLEITTDIDLCNQVLQQTGFKLQIITEMLPVEPSLIRGFNNSCDVEINFYGSSGLLIAHLSGSYQESNDTMPCNLTIFSFNKGTTPFNWHPFGTMGELDKNEFSMQFN